MSNHSVIATAINTNGVSESLFLNSQAILHCITAYVDYIAENMNAVSVPAEFNIADNTPYNQIYTVEFYPQTQLLTVVSYMMGSSYKSRYTAIIRYGAITAQDYSTVNHDNYFTQAIANKLYDLYLDNGN